MARTRLTNAWFDGKLKTVSTARNWNTVGKLLELAGMKDEEIVGRRETLKVRMGS